MPAHRIYPLPLPPKESTYTFSLDNSHSYYLLTGTYLVGDSTGATLLLFFLRNLVKRCPADKDGGKRGG